MKSLLLFIVSAYLCLSAPLAYSMQCADIIKPVKFEKKYDKVLKNFLMVNLIYPQIDTGVLYVIIGLILSGQATHQDISDNLYNAPRAKLANLYTAMIRTHTAHGIQTDIPFSRIISFTKEVQKIADHSLLTTLFALFPDYKPKAQNLSGIIKEFSAILADESDPKIKKIRAYGELILTSLRDPEIMALAKDTRNSYRNEQLSRIELIAMRASMTKALIESISEKLEEAFPETKEEVGPIYGDDAPRSLSRAIGTFF